MKYLLLPTLLFLSASAGLAFAQSPAPTGPADEKVEVIKEKVAKKVEELRNQILKKAVMGEILEINEPNLKLNLGDASQILSTTDETRFIHFNAQRKKIDSKFENYEKGEEIAVVGNFDQLTEQLNALMVISKTPRWQLAGQVVSKGQKNTFVLKDISGQEFTAQIDSETEMIVFDNGKQEKTDFKALKEGLEVQVNGFALKGKAKTVAAARVLLLPTISKIPASTPIPTPSP